MATLDDQKQHYTFESRLLSFKIPQAAKPKRRTSVASKKNQNQKTGWPHSFLSPQSLAEAGFYFAPIANADDNVTCFLCEKSLAGWEEGDDSLVEHLKHSPECGWAIVASIQAGNEELKNEDPMSERMKQARRDTFGDLWPHDSKKGWTPKSKQMADSGWICTLTPDSEDMATCAYCSLMLDAWEPKDKPMIEHRNRSGDCDFFRLVNEHKKTATKSKSTRASKASRLSTQSNITSAPEAPSFVSEPAEEDDSIMTTATNATVQSRIGGKVGKGSKATTAKGRKTRARKQEPEEVVEEVVAPEPEQADDEAMVDAPRMTRGKKRTSDEMEEGTTVEQPQATKRRVTRTRGSMASEESTILVTEQVAEEPTIGPPPVARKRGRPSRASRKISTASVAAEPEQIPDDDAIDRALEADLEKPLTDDESKAVDTEVNISKTRRVSRATTKITAAASPKAGIRQTRASTVSNLASSMFDSQPVEIDESSIEKELAAMEIEQSKPLPKAKAAKTKQARKPSAKQLAAARKAEHAAQATREAEELAQAVREAEEAAQAAADADAMILDSQHEEQPKSPEPATKAREVGTRQPRQVQAQSTRASATSVDVAVDSYFPPQEELTAATQENDSGNDTDNSMASQSTVIKGGKTRRGSALKKGRGGKKAMTRHIEDIIHKDNVEVVIPAKQTAKSRKGKEAMRNMDDDAGLAIFEDAIESEAERAELQSKAKSKKDKGKGKVLQELPIDSAPSAATPTSLSVPFSPKLVSSSRKSPQPPLTPGGPQEVNASPSPQSSDAENHPPSSRPSTVRNSLNLQDSRTNTNKQMTRIPLVSTPTGSPSKRNIINGLQTTQPWTALDLDTMFAKSPSKNEDTENIEPGHLAFNEILERARTGNVTSPEKNMTVEQWIVHNAEMAEAKLKGECERLVGVFEAAGQRAMRSVEGIKCHDDE